MKIKLKLIPVLMAGLFGCAYAQSNYFIPNTENFTCPDGQKFDSTQKVDVSVGQVPQGFGNCFWGNPKVSFSLNQEGNSISGLTTWKLDGGSMADGCTGIKGEKITTAGVIAKVSCISQDAN